MLCLGACQFARPQDVPDVDAATDAPIDSAGPLFTVGGTVSGMWSGASVQLTLTALPDQPVAVTVDASGSFTFPGGLLDGRSFTVAVASGGQPTMHTCTVANPAGTIAGADVTDVQVQCHFDGTFDVTWSAPIAALDAGFDPNVTRYSGEVAQGVQTCLWTATGVTGASWSINGSPGSVGFSRQIPFDNGPTTIVLHVVLGALSNDYTYALDRTELEVSAPVYLKAPNTGANDGFGSSVAAEGPLLVVGAPNEDSAATGVDGNGSDNASTDAGAAYVLRRRGLVWMVEAYLKPSANVSGAHFGASVAIWKGTVIVGAPGDGATVAGAVYFFGKSGTTWSQTQRLAATGSAKFGASLALADTFLAIGAPNVAAGGVSIYHWTSAAAGWTPTTSLSGTILGASTGAQFGAAVAMAPDLTLLIGAPLDDSIGGGVADTGAVYAFKYDGANWVSQGVLRPAVADSGDQFGASVSVAADVAVIGAPGEDSLDATPENNLGQDPGAAYRFTRTGTTWSQGEFIKATPPLDQDRFGTWVGVHGDLIAVGAPDTAAQDPASGRVLVWRHTPATLTAIGVLRNPASDAFDDFGTGAALSGEGILVAAPREDGAGTGTTGSPADDSAANAGAVFAFY